jgi:hypothetical protein
MLCACPALLASAQSATENQVKAAYLFNFAKFVEWPEAAFDKPGSPMNFCLLGRGAVADEMDLMQGKSVNGHTITVTHLHRPEEIKGCHLVFLAASAGKQQTKLLETATRLPILLVAETPGFARAGGTINFITENDRLLFEINIKAAESAQLKISSKLLTLAHVVSPIPERPGQ